MNEKYSKSDAVTYLIIFIVFMSSIFITKWAVSKCTISYTTSPPKTLIQSHTEKPVLLSGVTYNIPSRFNPPQVEKVSEVKSVFSYTSKEFDLLSRLVDAEVGVESYKCKTYVASVVMNRVVVNNSNVHDVIYAKNQFSVTDHYRDGMIAINNPASDDSKKAAKEILTNGSLLPLDVQVFYEKSCKNKWLNSRKIYAVVDNTVFAYMHKMKGDK